MMSTHLEPKPPTTKEQQSPRPPPSKTPTPRISPPPDEAIASDPPSSDVIEAEDGSPEGEAEEDEFLPTGWDATSSNASTSITSSVYHHTFENGRRYHAYKYGRYPIPNDDLEQNREDMKHSMMLEITDGKLFYAPIGDNPGKIVDIGTGTGIWAMEMGDQFPGAEILGLDLSPIQPQWVPPNVRFIVDDVEDEWASGSGWDYAHLRSMALILRNLQRTVGQIFHNLKPGGWIEFQESHGIPECDDRTMDAENDIMKRYYEVCQQAMAKFGMDLGVGATVGDYLSRAGFVNVTRIRKKVPIGTWPKDKIMRLIGLYSRDIALHSIPSMDKPFANLGMSETERAVWGAQMRAALRDNRVHRYYHYYFWFAQKPE